MGAHRIPKIAAMVAVAFSVAAIAAGVTGIAAVSAQEAETVWVLAEPSLVTPTLLFRVMEQALR